MKKVFALVLAVAMVMSLTAVSFAKTKNEVWQGVVAVDPTAHRYGADNNEMIVDVIQYGKAAYYALYASDDSSQFVGGQLKPSTISGEDSYYLVSDSEMVDGMKVKVDYEMGKELVAENGVSIVKKRVSDITYYAGKDEKLGTADDIAKASELFVKAFNNLETKGEYFYFVEIKTVAKETTSDADIIATLILNKSKKGDDKDKNDKALNYKIKDLEVDISTNVGYEHSYLDSGVNQLKVTGDSVEELEPETYYLLKYDHDEETEFTFGLEPNEGTFTVDVSGQGKNLIYFDTIIDEDIYAANKEAKIFALNFNNTKFNRTGEFVYEAEDMEYAYQVMEDGSLKLLGEFDGEEVSFKTRVLGKYLFSDVELVAAAKDEPVVTPSEVPTVEVTNPTTGAIA